MSTPMSRIHVLRSFFEQGTDRKVESTELMQFFKACTQEERQEFATDAAKQLGLTLATEV